MIFESRKKILIDEQIDSRLCFWKYPPFANGKIDYDLWL